MGGRGVSPRRQALILLLVWAVLLGFLAFAPAARGNGPEREPQPKPREKPREEPKPKPQPKPKPGDQRAGGGSSTALR